MKEIVHVPTIDDPVFRNYLVHILVFEKKVRKYGLTVREAQVALMVLNGFTSKEICHTIGISYAKLKDYRYALIHKGYLVKRKGPSDRILKMYKDLIKEIGV